MDQELDRLLKVFQSETAENLATLEQSLLALESLGSADAELVHAMLRAAHTVKGNAAIVADDEMERAAHTLEDTLEGLREGTIDFSPELVTMLLDGVDSLRVLLRRHTAAAPVTEVTKGTEVASARRATLRVDVNRLDTLLDLTGEITITRGRLGQLLGEAAGGDASLAGTLWQLEQLHAALQGEVMELRMVPLGPVLDAQRRTVRDVALKVGKQAQLVIDGHDVEVDTSIAEQMRDPLTHMVRNAVDHGIEPAADRLVAGKPAAGTITLRASHQAGTVVIELSDDGRGLDRDRIAAKAQALGLISDSAALTDEQVFALIFTPGFSTAAETTNVSGRGVGMDVVQRHVQALRGTIEIAATPGHGTRFTIRLPLTVAIISGFTVGVGDERYVLPLESVEQCVDFSRARDHALNAEGLLDLRGSALPWLLLRDVLGLPVADTGRASVVVIRHGERRIGLVVDALDGDCQAVIKPLGGALQRLPGISGSTILGNGRVALILNVPQLVELAMARGSRGRAA